MANPWAPKSAYDEAGEPLVERAGQWRAALYCVFFLLGLALGYGLFQVLDPLAAARPVVALEGDESLFLLAAWMVVCALACGELGLMLWLLLCRYHLRLSAPQALAALRAGAIPSFTLARLYGHLYPSGLP